MSVENGANNLVNRFFNHIADRAREYAESLLEYRRQNSARGRIEMQELDDLFLIIPYMGSRTIQSLASLSASITGGRKLSH